MKKIVSFLLVVIMMLSLVACDDNGREEIVTEKSTIEEMTTEETTTEEASTEEATTEAAGTEEATTEAVSTEEATTEAASTEEATTEAAGTEEATTEAAGTEEATTEAVSTEEATTEAASTEEATTEAATTEEATTEEATTEEATTEEATTEEATTEEATTEEATTEEATTEEATTEETHVHNTLVHYEAKEATYTSAGWNAYDKCSSCDYSTKEEIYRVLINEPLSNSESYIDNSHIYDAVYEDICMYGTRIKGYENGVCSLHDRCGNYIFNVTPLNGLESITVTFNNNTAYIRAASTFSDLVPGRNVSDFKQSDYTELRSGEPYYFEDGMAYFIIIPNFEDPNIDFLNVEDLNIQSIDVTYIPSRPCAETLFTDDFDLTLKTDGTYEIARYTGVDSTVIIPEAIHETPITSISPSAFERAETLTKLVIPGTVKEITGLWIGNYTTQCTVVLQEGVETIADYAFWNCNHVIAFIPDSVENIGKYALPVTVFFTGDLPENMTVESLMGSEEIKVLPNDEFFVDYESLIYGHHIYQYGYDKALNAVQSTVEEQQSIYYDAAIQYAEKMYSSPEYDWKNNMKVVKASGEFNYFMQLATSLTEGLSTDGEKIQCIFDYIVNNIVYDIDAMTFSAYQSLIEKRAVCSQYALIFIQLARCLDIPALYVGGFASTRNDYQNLYDVFKYNGNNGIENLSHAWALVYYDGAWRWMDPTWGAAYYDFRPDKDHFPVTVEFVTNAIDGLDYMDLTGIIYTENGMEAINTGTYNSVSESTFYGNINAYIVKFIGKPWTTYRFDEDYVHGTFYQDGWVHDIGTNEKVKYVYIDGRMLYSESIIIDGIEYSFDEQGYLIKD